MRAGIQAASPKMERWAHDTEGISTLQILQRWPACFEPGGLVATVGTAENLDRVTP
jgi:hypothetical protein